VCSSDLLIEGIYACPRCGKKIIAELRDDTDTRDKISDLSITTETDFCNTIFYQLISPVIVKSAKDELIVQVDSIEIRIPTLNDCILAMKQTGLIGGARFQMALYKNCLVKKNGDPIDAKFRAEWGIYIFEQMDIRDLRALYAPIQKYGIQSTVEKRCMDCGKVWEAPINTTNFFVSGLQSN
jgi:DNA-directed RNA polymerase subunit RPC12/RpoP